MKLNEYMQVSSLFFYLMLCGLTERIFENAYAYRVVMFFYSARSCVQSYPRPKTAPKEKER